MTGDQESVYTCSVEGAFAIAKGCVCTQCGNMSLAGRRETLRERAGSGKRTIEGTDMVHVQGKGIRGAPRPSLFLTKSQGKRGKKRKRERKSTHTVHPSSFS